MRKQIVAGNWKMNNNLQETKELINDIAAHLPQTNTKVMVAPTFVYLQHAVAAAKDSPIEIIAQNMHFAAQGAYTGEISSTMLQDIGVQTVILGHSERRAYFGEDASLLRTKVDRALEVNMQIVFCFGEELEDRKAGNHFDVVQEQLSDALFHLGEKAWEQIVLAYEPVWAIGTGETASGAQAQEMHAFVRNTLEQQYNGQLAASTSILYGGSVKPNNAADLFSNPDVDGGLIGGAALKAEDFIAIIKAI
ncbi:MAG: triose-phosphate isomerase [Flavobacteriaceae bacterium]|nr:triose-phosphate isomerase [Flavobacteriaceae bacterium]